MTQGRSQDFGSGGGEGQTKFPVKWQEFRFEAVTLKKNLLNKEFLKIFYIYINIAQKFIKFSQKYFRKKNS